MGRTRTTSQRIKSALKVLNDFDAGKFPEPEEPKSPRLPVWMKFDLILASAHGM